MDDVGWWLYLLLVFFIVLGAYFAASEIALASVSQSRLKIRADKGDKNAAKTLYILSHFDKAISTILIGNNIAHVFTASVATLMATRLWGSGSLVYVTIGITIIVFFISEMLPKTLAKAYSERFSVFVSPSLSILMFLFKPVSVLLSAIGNLFSRLFNDEKKATVTEEEFYSIIESIKDEGAMEDEKGDWVHTALKFGDKLVDNIKTVRTDIMAVDCNDDEKTIFDTIKNSKHSRIPVYNGSIDEIIGVLQIRKYLRASFKLGKPANIHDFLDPPLFVFHSTHIDELLPEMSRQKVNLAVVTNTFGGVVGVVTVEDILEELVGEIWDEDDIAVEYFRQVEQYKYEADASMLVEEVFELIGMEDSDVDQIAHDTLSTWVYETMARIPHEGDRMVYKDLVVTILNMDKRRIRNLLLEYCPPDQIDDAGGRL